MPERKVISKTSKKFGIYINEAFDGRSQNHSLQTQLKCLEDLALCWSFTIRAIIPKILDHNFTLLAVYYDWSVRCDNVFISKN